MTTKVVRSIAEMRYVLAGPNKQVGLVPTMGALHSGHGRLIETAVRECSCVVVSVFVNTIQFDREDDFSRYPRDLDADLEFCRERGVHFVFAPSVEEMYPRPQRAFVEVTKVGDHLCGPFRPGHFRGVATVVLKLFNIVQPAKAYFGEKDAQQVAVVRRMIEDLNVPVELVNVPTVREADGLAMSSRNRHLTQEQRHLAVILNQALCEAGKSITSGITDPGRIKTEAALMLGRYPEVRLEYFDIVDPEEMQPVHRIEAPVRVAGAIWIGSTRLIDNVLCDPLAGARVSVPSPHR